MKLLLVLFELFSDRQVFAFHHMKDSLKVTVSLMDSRRIICFYLQQDEKIKTLKELRLSIKAALFSRS